MILKVTARWAQSHVARDFDGHPNVVRQRAWIAFDADTAVYQPIFVERFVVGMDVTNLPPIAERNRRVRHR